VATKLANDGYVLRSGGAIGADKAFEAGCGGKCQIFYANDATTESMAIAAKVHPAWHRCSEYAKKLHGRNVFQVLGKDLKTPSTFLLCWTPGAKLVGGTATAMRLAELNNVPIYNLADPFARRRVENYVNV